RPDVLGRGGHSPLRARQGDGGSRGAPARHTHPGAMRGAALALAVGAALTSCDHSLPGAATLDRGQGPVSEGTPARLTHNPVTVAGYAVDGRGIIIRRPDSPAVNRPVGDRHLPRSDAAEACVA